MKIRWTHEALLRLFEIEDFISQDSPDRASVDGGKGRDTDMHYIYSPGRGLVSVEGD